LEKLLCQFGAVARAQNKQISLVAFNTYLAALCDVVTEKDASMQQQRGDTSGVEGVTSSSLTTPYTTTDYKTEALEQAWQWIQDPAKTAREMVILPDTVSYATVIQAAATVGNQTLVDAIWKEFKARNIKPNIVAYNARLRTVTAGSGDSSRHRQQHHLRDDVRAEHKKRDREILAVWDNEIATDPYVSPDKYSIDLLLLPLIRAGRVGDVEALLDIFVKRNSETVVSNAFTAFLLTVVGGGELSTARALFETYILPTLSPVMVGDAGGMIRMVRPTTRHFNVLLEGYRRVMEHTDNDVAKYAAAEEGWGLYRLMMQSLGARPDAYTITSMMGLCRTSTELSNLLFEAISDVDIDCSSVVLRAACKSIYCVVVVVVGHGQGKSHG
jgi:Pentatricopeptide repeat domain